MIRGQAQGGGSKVEQAVLGLTALGNMFIELYVDCTGSPRRLRHPGRRGSGVRRPAQLADLVMWAAAILLWRISRQDTLLNYLAWVVLSVCGIRIFFNLNPLLKLLTKCHVQIVHHSNAWRKSEIEGFILSSLRAMLYGKE